MLSAYCYAVRKQQRRISGGSECALRYHPCRRVFHVVPAGWLDGKDATGPRQLCPAYCIVFSLLHRQ